MTREALQELIRQMTLEEKASLCSGEDFWHTKEIARLGIPASMVSDGPHGLRKQNLEADHLGMNESIKAVCFPAGCGAASSFNRELITRMGQALGDECQAEGVSVILGPAVNIKRSPLCGRNFEYYSEDPYLASETAAAHIKGVQSKNVGTSIKHFLANNQETRRMSVSASMDERTMREIYLAAFEGAVKQAKPWTVMCSYNRINGTYAAQNKETLTDILRDEWGFDGYVVSDWGAVNDRVEDLKAGLDLEMPSSGGASDEAIVQAVRDGSLKEEVLDQAVERILGIVYRFQENRDPDASFDLEAHDALSREVASESIVLLKNDGILPLPEDAPVAFIGKFAETPRYQGGGSSHINSFRITSALDAVKGMPNVTYAQGYQTQKDQVDKALEEEAVKAAREAKAAVIFVGLPDSFESEGYDRSHMKMPDCQNHLIDRVLKVQPNTVIVLHNGSPVEMPWAFGTKGILEAYLGGQAVGAAVCDILFGRVNPSGHLAETFPLRLEDNPSWLYGFGEKDEVSYGEGIFLGYRYYEKKKMDVLFPFGHGLSYTTFSYSGLTLDRTDMTDQELLKVTVDVTNTGSCSGKEVVQLYVADLESTVLRPAKELKGFEKVSLAPGETKTVSFTLDKRAFAYWNTQIHDWHVESGAFEIQVGSSSRDIRVCGCVNVHSTVRLPKVYTMDTTIGDLMEDPKAMSLIGEFLKGYAASQTTANNGEASKEAITEDMTKAMIQYTPLRGMIAFSNGAVSPQEVQRMLDALNAPS
ncbi:MAG: glycoside hydrolase family 3 C-terminal domain-containing protein [Eubacteriales bacterium]|nr:glycoside hydrolase family 3 C-terminal domain-containing protein [Eubacteriales bacterium]